MSEPQVAKI